MNSCEPLIFAGSEGQSLVADAFGDPRAQPILFLHGGGQTRHAWGGAAKAIADCGFRTITIDQRGHGESAHPPSGDYRFPQFAADLDIVARQVQQSSKMPPIIIGASLGGLAALGVATRKDRSPFLAISLVDITPWMNPEGVDRIMGFMREHLDDGFASLDEAAAAISAYLPHRTRTFRAEGLRKNLIQGADGRFRWHWHRDFVDGPLCVSVDGQEARDKIIENLDQLTLPVQLVRGGESELVDLHHVEAFIKMVPHTRYDDISGAGHMVAGDRNDVFSETILEFCAHIAKASR